MEQITKTIQALQQDPLRYIVHLKMLELYGSDMEIHPITQADETGYLLLLPTAVSSYDRVAYPDAEFVVLLAAQSDAVLNALVEQIPKRPLVCKLIDRAQLTALLKRWNLTQTTAVRSYTSPDRHFAMPDDVRIVDAQSAALQPLFATNGYDATTMAAYVAQNGCRAFALYEAGEVLSACMIYQNYGVIWEVAGVHTVTSARRRGLAARVVTAALAHLQEQGLTSRYQVHIENGPSIRLAETVGLVPFLTVEHYVTQHE